jgi:hypothetical protein
VLPAAGGSRAELNIMDKELLVDCGWQTAEMYLLLLVMMMNLVLLMMLLLLLLLPILLDTGGAMLL